MNKLTTYKTLLKWTQKGRLFIYDLLPICKQED